MSLSETIQPEDWQDILDDIHRQWTLIYRIQWGSMIALFGLLISTTRC